MAELQPETDATQAQGQVEAEATQVEAQPEPDATQADNQSETGAPQAEVGVGPWPGGPENWPTEDHYDPELLAEGDRRNVLDEYRYWKLSAIVADLDTKRRGFHVAIENLGHDFNIGSIIRTANSQGVATVHIVGRKRFNRRGAMVTDRYLHLFHHPTVEDFVKWCEAAGVNLVGIDILPGAKPIEAEALPEQAMLVFGTESEGLSAEMLAACPQVRYIQQYGSTRSMNVGHAAAIAMWAWNQQCNAGELVASNPHSK
ncbi:TrmH family RNA methyltransferase [Boudabousia liubingyangii]|uniref:TrmH family RNA methyltransferase n=1 Tax=Boudabousia liubingyangii TaxID=1921764 RepID=UPI000B2B8D1A|nr:RNA methyltransferase [Boudabousia liubingyangii]